MQPATLDAAGQLEAPLSLSASTPLSIPVPSGSRKDGRRWLMHGACSMRHPHVNSWRPVSAAQSFWSASLELLARPTRGLGPAKPAILSQVLRMGLELVAGTSGGEEAVRGHVVEG